LDFGGGRNVQPLTKTRKRRTHRRIPREAREETFIEGTVTGKYI
jgi:hypothetical protein